MKRVGALVLVFIAAIAVSAFAFMSENRSDAGDRRATDAFVEATYLFNRRLVLTWPTVETTVERRVAHIIRDCPRVMAGAPRGEAFRELNLEVLMAPVLTSVDAQSTIIGSYIDAIVGLKWSEAKLMRLVGTTVGELQAELRVASPRPCADIRSWIKSDYRQVPASTEQFNGEFPFPTREFPEGGGGEFLAVGPQPVTRFENALRPYADLDDRTILDEIVRSESEVSGVRNRMRSEDARQLTRGLLLDSNFQRFIVGGNS
jgi:hypothetical protein